MIEPTESEPRAGADRLCDALIAIRAEIRAVGPASSTPRTTALQRAAHRARGVGGRVAPTATPAKGGVARGMAARAQVLAAGGPDRQRLRRTQPGLHLPPIEELAE